MTERVGAVVIGAGVVGLACARALARAGKEVLILERHGEIGSEASARNSEVIHAGIYYPSGSLKAQLCLQGKRRLYDFCAQYGVAHRRCGKLIVATDAAQEPRLAEIKARAEANGVDDLKFLDRREALEMEPELQCTRALWSPSTGIINSHELMLALLGEAERHEAMLALHSPVASAELTDNGIRMVIGSDSGDELLADVVVNSAGMSAPALAGRTKGMPPELVPRAYLAKGNYFSLSGKAPFSRLIYPVPESGGLGVHLTLDLGGQARFGPDVEWIDEIGYEVDPKRGDRFYSAIRKYWRGLPDNALQPAYSGIRAKIAAPGEPDEDFRIQGPRDHGVPGLVNLFGIESPGLTACIAIADAVCESLGIAAPAS
jgi:L-2-hydroxyglutarate oxidase LhgO